jgi:PAS domain S-box-containing protein
LKNPLLITGCGIFFFFFLLLFTSRLIFLNSYVDLEEREVRQNQHRATSVYLNKIGQLNTVAGDYAGWDESHRFVQDGNTAFIKTNLANAMFPKLRLDMILFIKPSGKITYEKSVDLQTGKEKIVPSSLHSLIDKNSPLVRHSSNDSILSGVIILPEGPLLVVSRPILTSEYKGPIAGTLIMARYLGSTEIGGVAEITGLPTQFYNYNQVQLPAEIQSVRTALNDDKSVQIRRLSSDSVAGYSLIRDIYGKPALILKVKTPRNVYKQGITTIGYYVFAVLGICLLSALIGYLLYSKLTLSQRKHHESEENIKTLMELMPVGVRWSNKEGKIEYINNHFVELFGYTLADIPTINHWFSCAYPEQAYREAVFATWNEAVSEAQANALPVPPIETNVTCKDGSVRRIIINTRFIRDCTLVICTDITEHESIQNEQLKTQKLESLGVLAGGIAHDFNNILTVISGNIALAQKFLEPPHRSLKLLDEAEKAANRAAELAHQLLTFAKGGEPIKKAVSVQNLAQESLLLALRGSNVQGIIEIPDSIHAIEADEGQLSQTFNNIIINAEQAMPEGGTLTIYAENIVLADKNKQGLQPGNFVKICFADGGCGISDEDLKKIFDPYFTTKTGGTGLGLTSAYSIINKHGGYIEVNSVVGKGTVFTLYLPSIGKPFTETPAFQETLPAINLKGGAILVMDDEEMLRVFFTEILTYLGYKVTTCTNGEEAIELYKAASLSNRPYSAVIMDLTIPGGMGGKEAAQHILAFDSTASLIVASGYSNDPVMADYKQFGFCAAVAKPCKPDEIARVLSPL